MGNTEYKSLEALENGMCPNISIIQNLSNWLMQFVQYFGNIDIKDLFVNNKL